MQLDIGALGKPGVTDKFVARALFFDSLKECAPAAIDNLATNVFRVYRKAMSYKELPFKWLDFIKLSAKDSNVMAAIDAIYEWTSKYNLECIWVFETITSSFSMWLLDPEMRSEIGIVPWVDEFSAVTTAIRRSNPSPIYRLNKPISFVVTVPEFNSYNQSPSDYAKLVAGVAKEVAIQHTEKILRNHELDGWEPTHVIKRKRDSDDPSKHFKWLVHFQVNTQPYSWIAEQDLGNSNLKPTIREAVIKTAHLIALPLRTTGPGRPRKNS